MNARKQARLIALAGLALLVSGVFAVPQATAREPIGGDASARGGGSPPASRNFTRQGAASTGSLGGASRSGKATASAPTRQAAAGTRSANQGARQSAVTDAGSANQAQRQAAVSENQERRQSTSSSNQAQRQQASNENVETRQAGATARQQERTAYPPGYRAPVAGYYDDDDDDWDAGSAVVGFAAGAVVGAVVTDAAHDSTPAPASTPAPSSAPPPAPEAVPVVPAGLPCAPAVSSMNGVTYYQCDQAWFVQAYGPSGPFYMPVQPPAP